MSIMACEMCETYVDTDFFPTHTIETTNMHGKLVEIEVCAKCAEELEMKAEIERD